MVKVKSFYAFFLLNVLAASAFAKQVVRVEHNDYGFFEQQALVYENPGGFASRKSDTVQRATYTSNSNFICGPQNSVKLGLFERDLNEHDKDSSQLLKQIDLRMKAAEGFAGRKSDTVHSSDTSSPAPHQIRYFLGKKDLTYEKPYVDSIAHLFKKACNSDWKAKKGVEINWHPQKKNVLQMRDLISFKSLELSSKETKCKDVGKMQNAAVLKCTIPQYGQILLLRP
jgi:hypothetical protein